MEPHLQSTQDLLLRAFGGPVPEDCILPCMRVLYDHMSDRNLAAVMANVNGGDASAWLNDVWRAAQLSLDDPSVVAQEQTLSKVGFAEWIAEP
ncbi:MAG: hypothetical protein AAF602_09300 [Myxococcota bacterium]